jgi:hypothetical protein
LSRYAQPVETTFDQTYNTPGQDQYINRISKYQTRDWKSQHYFKLSDVMSNHDHILDRMVGAVRGIFTRLKKIIGGKAYIDIVVGLDWILDRNFKVWLLEINVAPDLNNYSNVIDPVKLKHDIDNNENMVKIICK